MILIGNVNVQKVFLFTVGVAAICCLLFGNNHLQRKGLAEDDVCPTCNIYDLRQPNDFEYKCVKMKFRGEPDICLHPLDKDQFVSKRLAENGTWEPVQVSHMMAVLEANPSMGLIDIGTNLGVYSLVAASMGHRVISVEPYLENARRFHKAIRLGKLENRVTLLLNAVSNRRGATRLYMATINQGRVRIDERPTDGRNTTKDEASYVQLITLDDLVPLCRFRQAFMKIDIEGNELKAFAAADRLFGAIDIVYIQMEWAYVKRKRLEMETGEDVELWNQMMEFFERRNYLPETIQHQPLNTSTWQAWPFDVIWRKTGGN